MNVYEKLRKLREYHGYTIKNIADFLGVDQQTAFLHTFRLIYMKKNTYNMQKKALAINSKICYNVDKGTTIENMMRSFLCM